MMRLHCDAPDCNEDAPMAIVAGQSMVPPGWVLTGIIDAQGQSIQHHACGLGCHDMLAEQLRTVGTP